MAPIDGDEIKETNLSPEVRRIRNSIIKKFAHEPLDIMAKFVKDVVDNEEDTVKRLGAMAARVEILRMRISQIADSEANLNFDPITDAQEEEEFSKEEKSEIVITSPNLSDWVRLRIIENSEINGVRFPKGVVIDVAQEDGDRLLESGKASYVDEDEITDIKSSLGSAKDTKEQSALPIAGVSEGTIIESAGVDSESTELAEVSEGTIMESTDVGFEIEIEKSKAKKPKHKKNIEDVPSAEDMLAGFDLEAKDTENKS